MFKWIAVLLNLVIMLPVGLYAENTSQSSLVKIYVVSNEPNYANPWNMDGPESGGGSGAVITGKRILTNAHVVSDQTYLQIRLHGEAKKYDAYVIAVSHETDLAILGVKDPSFFDGIEPLRFGELPNLQDPIVVCGFPLGGDTISMTTGVVSRIEHQRYIHSYLHLLAIQVDAAVNPGNSGGPALSDDGRLVGVAMETRRNAQGIAYLIPAPVIRHFLMDLEDGKYDGVPTLGISCQNTENSDLREKLDMKPEMTGVLVNKVAQNSSANGLIESGDVILNIEGFNVANDSTIEFRPQERTSFFYAVQRKQIGETIEIIRLRDGEPQKVSIQLRNKIGNNRLVAVENDKPPTYFVYGGVVFNPLTLNYLKCWGDSWYSEAPSDLSAYLKRNWKSDYEKEIVVLNRVLPTEENEGYHHISDQPIAFVNGQPISCMEDLVKILDGKTSGYVDIETAKGYHLILKSDKIKAANKSILTKYKINSDRSEDLIYNMSPRTDRNPVAYLE
jgi:S1-C subfamily serine protease